MTTLEDREKGFEKKFAADQEREFLAQSRGNRMLGEWAAKKMGLENVEDYVRAVMRAELGAGGEDDVLRKVLQDSRCARPKCARRPRSSWPSPANR